MQLFSGLSGVFLVTLCLAAPVLAQGGSQVPEWLGLKDFPEARALVREYQPDSPYVLALSTYKKIGGSWTAEREQRIQGDVTRRTLELPSDYSAKEGYAFYREQLAEHRLRELFACQQRECGGSNNWANNHFNVIQLYGLDQHQYYGVYELTDGNAVYYASLYSVRRGNKRVYVQLDLVQMPRSERTELTLNPQTFRAGLRDSGYLVLPGFDVLGSSDEWEVQVNEKALDSLAEVLRQERDWHIALVGHDYAASSLDEQRAHSLQYAEAVRDELTSLGIPENRITVYGVGSLAPAGKGDRSARVEVVRLPER